MNNRPKRVLFISNGHGEDNHSGYVIRALREQMPDVELGALPIVGMGAAYRKLNVPILGPTKDLPSGGFTKTQRFNLLRDIAGGLVTLTIGQLRALRRHAPSLDLVHATGDVVGQTFAKFSGKPYISFISCRSALYEDHLPVEPLLRRALASPRCLAIATRDRFTAEDLRNQGYDHAVFGGIPSLDWIVPEGRDLDLAEDQQMVAMMPGSRIPEAIRNFERMLDFVRVAAPVVGPSVAFRAALVPRVFAVLDEVAAKKGWQRNGKRLRHADTGAEVLCHADAFNDIASRCTLVLGMAGLAVDQAVALGKPVIQIVGEGPQFNYGFAEAQERLLGLSAQTLGTKPPTEAMLAEGAAMLDRALRDADYLDAARKNGIQRFGARGGADRIARLIVGALDTEAAVRTAPRGGEVQA